MSYDAALRRATLDPTSLLTGGATYGVTVRGGATGVKDAAGNALAADDSWSFTIAMLKVFLVPRSEVRVSLIGMSCGPAPS